jgi:hypothetical protein
MEVAHLASDLHNDGVVAFGRGGDELSLPLSEFRRAYRFASEQGLHLVCHAGETGGPEQIKDAIDILGAERIGHGIAAIRSSALMNTLASRRIPLEICPTSNLRTSALDIQLNSAHCKLANHPLPSLFRHGIPVTLSTDDPAMFRTTLPTNTPPPSKRPHPRRPSWPSIAPPFNMHFRTKSSSFHHTPAVLPCSTPPLIVHFATLIPQLSGKHCRHLRRAGVHSRKSVGPWARRPTGNWTQVFVTIRS